MQIAISTLGQWVGTFDSTHCWGKISRKAPATPLWQQTHSPHRRTPQPWRALKSAEELTDIKAIVLIQRRNSHCLPPNLQKRSFYNSHCQTQTCLGNWQLAPQYHQKPGAGSCLTKWKRSPSVSCSFRYGSCQSHSSIPSPLAHRNQGISFLAHILRIVPTSTGSCVHYLGAEIVPEALPSSRNRAVSAANTCTTCICPTETEEGLTHGLQHCDYSFWFRKSQHYPYCPSGPAEVLIHVSQLQECGGY